MGKSSAVNAPLHAYADVVEAGGAAENNIVLLINDPRFWASGAQPIASRRAKDMKGAPPTRKSSKTAVQKDAQQDDNSKDQYVEAIQGWVQDIRLKQAAEREEIAQLEGVQRFITLSKGILPNIIHLCRRAKRADTRLGVLAIVHLCADNSDGLCRLSVARFAQLLCRKEDSIRDALSDLEKGGEICVEHSAYGNSYWPRIPAEVIHASPSVGWIMDALSDKPRTVGRPSKKYPPLTRGVFSKDDGVAHGSSEDLPHTDISHNSAISSENTPPLRGEIPPPYAGTYITKLNRSDSEIAINKGDSRYSSTREASARSGCKSSDGNGEVR